MALYQRTSLWPPAHRELIHIPVSSLSSDDSILRTQNHQSSSQARSQSAPSLPHPGILSKGQKEGDGPSLDPMTPTTPKTVHFANSLAAIRVFQKKDSESSSTQVDHLRWNSWSAPRHERHEPRNIQSAAGTFETAPLFQIDLTTSSPIPLRFPSWASNRNIIMESLTLAGGADSSVNALEIDNNLRLAGTILVRNISFEKRVVVRFTFDNWARLTHYGRCTFKLFRLALQGVAITEGNREWWDNNSGSNYLVRFKRTIVDEAKAESNNNGSSDVITPLTSTHDQPWTGPEEDYTSKTTSTAFEPFR
ncbi:hypothetical protein DL96DRAFT_1688190 [Flagelloscypha sp. PMI_526]|nr:hypothetical protein DL96DRAFT_1688190 [Flagelloscypha sp. PMI_526]